MGRKKGLAIASAAAIGITALVLDTDFNPAAVANAIGAKCETQKEITVGYGYAKKYHTIIKDLFRRDEKDLAEFGAWIDRVETYLSRCYSWEQRKKYEKQHKHIEV